MRITWAGCSEGELAVERHPASSEISIRLEQEGVKALISLCAARRFKLSDGISERFRVGSPLKNPGGVPDHHYDCVPTARQISGGCWLN